MGAWQDGEVATNGITLHYTRTGGNKPPLVLAHGFSDDGLCWTPVAEALEADYDIVMVDARGHGRSAAPPSGYGSREMADDLAGAIKALGLRRPAILGHSMGAALTLALAGIYPDVPGAILLEDPPARWATPPAGSSFDAAWLARQQAQMNGYKSKTREELIAAQRAATPWWSDGELGPWADAKHRFNLNALNRNDMAAVNWPATLRQITCPALLITADPARGAIVTEESASQLHEVVPQLRIAHIPDAGHSIRRDQFARYLEVVRGFLAETTPAA
jgi:N-formylmaleamate deformylase